jgi:addiction module HigA family antidote
VVDPAARSLPPVSPGAVLRADFLEPLGLNASAVAHAIGVPRNRLGAIVNGSRAITADTALRLGIYFDTSAEFWLALQASYDLTRAPRDRRAPAPRDHPARGVRIRRPEPAAPRSATQAPPPARHQID